jgi:hypothetical protein
MALVKKERSEQSEFRAKLKKTKLDGMKERLENIAYLDNNGDDIIINANNDDADNDGGENSDKRDVDWDNN